MVGIVLIVAGACIVELAARRDLAAAIAEARAAGLPTTIAELEAGRANLADDENIAVQLLTCAEAISAWYESEEGRALSDDLPQLGTFTGPAAPEQLSARQVAATRAFAQENRKHLNVVRRALELGKGAYPVQWDKPGAVARMASLLGHRNIARALGTLAVLGLHQRDETEVRQCVEDLIRINVILEDDPISQGTMLSLHVDQVAIGLLKHALCCISFDDDGLYSLQRSVGSVAERYDLCHVLSVRYFADYQLLRGWSGLAAVPAFMRSSEKAPVYYRLCPGWAKFGLAGALRSWVQELERAKLDPADALRRYRERASQGGKRQHDLAPTSRACAVFAQALGRNLEEVLSITALSRAMVGMLALERYRLSHGSWPESLLQMVPEFLDAVPVDPFDRQPLRYQRENAGVRIWSIGANMVDDGGKIVPSAQDQPARDVGLQLPSPEARRVDRQTQPSLRQPPDEER